MIRAQSLLTFYPKKKKKRKVFFMFHFLFMSLDLLKHTPRSVTTANLEVKLLMKVKIWIYLLKNSSMVRSDHMTILRRWTWHDILAKIINGAFISPKRYHFSTIAASQTCNLAKCDAVSFDLCQRFAAVQHRVIKPSPRTWRKEEPSVPQTYTRPVSMKVYLHNKWYW